MRFDFTRKTQEKQVIMIKNRYTISRIKLLATPLDPRDRSGNSRCVNSIGVVGGFIA